MSLKTIAQAPAFDTSLSGVCTPVAVKFTDVSNIPGNVVSRTWNFGDGTTGTFAAKDIEAGHNYITDGDFPITLTLVMEDGRQLVSSAKTIIVKPRPVAGFETSTVAGCAPLDVTFTDRSTTTSGAITKWQWDFGDGSSTVQNPVHSFSDKKDFTVSLIVYNDYNCKSEVAAKEIIKVFDPAKAAFSSDKNGSCSCPFSINFNNTSTGNGSVSYSWDFGDGGTSSNKNPQHEFQAAGLFNVKLTVNNGTNCPSSIASRYIYAGTPNVSISSAPLIVCTGKSANYAAIASPSSLAQNITWYFPDDNTSAAGASASHIFSNNETYLIKVKAVSAIGCTSEATSFTTVKSSPIALFQATPTHLCKSPFAIRFDNISNYKGTGYEYVWNFGDGQLSTLEDPEHTYVSAASKYVTFTIKDKISGCESSPVSQFVDLREPSVTLDVVPQQGCKPLVIQATAAANANEQIVSYTWDWGDNTSSTTTTNTAGHFYINEGSYIVKVEIATENGCTAVSNGISVQVNDNCRDDGSGSGGNAASGGFSFLNTCENKNTIIFTDDFSKRTDNNYSVLSWDFGDGTTTGNKNPVVHTYTAAGTREYDVTVTRKDALTGAVSTSTKKMVIIDEKPIIYLTKTATCTQTQVPFRTSGIHAQYVKQYVWNFGDKSTKTINNSSFDPAEDGYTTHTYSSNGKYPVSLKITDKLGCITEGTYPDLVQISGPQADYNAPDILSCKALEFTKAVTDKSTPNASLPIDKWDWYIWRTGDAQPSTPTLSYTKDNIPEKILLPFKNASAVAAEYSVKLVVTDVDKCKSAPKTVSKLVKSYWPKAGFSVSRDSMCGSGIVNFYNASTTSSGTMNVWLFGDGSSSSLSSPTHAYPEDVNRYSVTLTVAEQNMPACKDTITKEKLIKVVKPVADFEISNPDECPPVAVSCTNKSFNAGPGTWTFSEGGSSAQKDISGHLYEMGGDYMIKLHVEGVDGCIDEITKPIHIKGPAGKLRYENTVGCVPFDFEMKVTDTKNVTSYSWDFGDGTLPVDPTAFAQTHTYTAPRKYLPNVIISSDEGCHISLVNEDSVIVDKVSAAFQLDSLRFCGNGTASVKEVSAASAVSEIASYKWKVNGELISDEIHPTAFKYNTPGEYEIALEIKNEYGCEASANEKVSIYEEPVVSINGREVVCLAKEVASFDYSAGIERPDAIETYKWLINDSLISTNEHPNVNYRQAGVHDLKLIATTINGCIDSSSKRIVIDNVRASFTTSANSICGENRNIFFTNTSTPANTIAKAEWDFGDGNYSVANNGTSHKYDLYGDVKAALFVTTENGCTDKSDAITIHLNQSPVLNIKGNNVICLPSDSPVLNYKPDITSADPIHSYSWLIDGAFVSADTILNTNYRQSGKHNLTLISTTKNGCTDSAIMTITIDSVKADFLVLDSVRCGAGNVSFINTSSSAFPITGYLWRLDDSIYHDQSTLTRYYAGKGNHTASLHVTTENNCSSSLTKENAIEIYGNPAVELFANKESCLNTPVDFIALTSSEDKIISYQWIVNNTPVKGVAHHAVKMFSDTGNYIVSYKAISEHDCTDSSSMLLIVHPLPSPVITHDTTICRGSAVTLRATGTDNYSWNNGSGDNLATRTGASLSVKPLVSTNFYLTATNKYNCSITDSVFVKVDKPVDLKVCDTQTICKGAKAQLSATANTSLFLWDNYASLNNPTIASPIASPLTSTAYHVTGVSGNACPDEKKSVMVNVVDNPIVSLGSDITVPAGSPVTLHASASGNIKSYLWNIATASKCISCQDLNFIADHDESIVLRVLTQEGCTASDTIAVHVLCNKEAVYIPTAFTPNGDGINDIFYIRGHALKKIKNFRIFDRWGKLVFYRENFTPNDIKAGWNGVVGGRPTAQSSTFIYIVDAVCQEDKNIQLKGTVLLIR
ncbi:PKD domain-containing protein [Danxiaibacter flavus]|uniref:PKD domain-containing protein n=1 Tax=Danxiaibacter flavus TaxID=3049108 RepID=A0ABV3ZGW5_9BACT|nr:PKD domain-containing protein [Chitinophagaceae bacterium DXS]